MRIGIPKGYYYYTYQPFLETFFNSLNIPVEISGETDKDILNKGISTCVDEACFPVKVFHGHVKSLAEKCDAVVVPRIMKTEFGESICPKISGLPDLAQGAADPKELIFTDPLYLDDEKALKRSLWKSCKTLGVSKHAFEKGFQKGIEAQRSMEMGLNEDTFRYKVFLAGHAYNVYDRFVNLNILDKLHKMDIGVVTEEQVKRSEKDDSLRYADLMKKPYWSFFINIFGSLRSLKDEGIDGVIYLSSFSCGTDSFTIEMLKNNIDNLPLLVLKLDEQRGEAGFDTRLEAFLEVLKGKARK